MDQAILELSPTIPSYQSTNSRQETLGSPEIVVSPKAANDPIESFTATL